MPSSHEIDTGEQSAAHTGEIPEHEAKPDAEHSASAHQPARPANGEAKTDRGELTGELAKIEDRYRRALADLDNYRKRSAREIDRRVSEAKESVLGDWFDAVDSVERAVQMEVDDRCRDGLRAILEQMDAVLQRHGVKRMGVQGDRFDPERHEAIATRTAGNVPEHTVLEVQRSGFARGDRVIRPAQVVVARAGEHAR
jgi:molecular chaperone GrpE